MSTVRKVIAVDVDEVCADLISEWVRRYNRDYDDALRPDEIVEWDMTKAVKPECGKAIYNYLHDANLYDHVRPLPHALAGVELLRRAGHSVVFVTSCVVGTIDAKVHWLIDHGFLPEQQFQPDFIAASSKHLIAADVLIDDHDKNISGFPGRGILIDRTYNRGYNAVERVPDLLEAALKFV